MTYFNFKFPLRNNRQCRCHSWPFIFQILPHDRYYYSTVSWLLYHIYSHGLQFCCTFMDDQNQNTTREATLELRNKIQFLWCVVRHEGTYVICAGRIIFTTRPYGLTHICASCMMNVTRDNLRQPIMSITLL